ncbi:tubulin epsilon and delta complex protein 1 isoform X6 [Pongo abelii]|uniref:tubulin epsilon and delta complex protein 1 isoform X6 n=1 Tax=Pongo abelii TaxID=9601 RepID=UPI0030041F21
MGRRRQRVDPAAGARAGALPEAIAALSRSLPSGPSPEIFRRAKFDRPEATSALWQLLFRVLSPLPVGNALASLALEAQAHLVKSALCSQGYPRLALAQLPEDGSQGSRELLLALSWLLARGPVPEQMLAQARVPLGDEMTVCQCEALASPGPPAPHMEAEGPVDVRRVQWLMGKLQFRWRQLVSSQQEQCALLSKKLPAAFRLCVTKQWDGVCAVKATPSWTLEGQEDSPCSHHILVGADLEGGQLLWGPEGGRGWLRGTGTQRHVHCEASADRFTCTRAAATATRALAICLSLKQRCSGTQREASSCCRLWSVRTSAWRLSWRGGTLSWSSGGGWLEAVDGGQSGVLRGGPLGRLWKRSWELYSSAGSKTVARPGPMGHTGW